MRQSAGDVTAFSHVNPSTTADTAPQPTRPPPPPLLSQRQFVLHSYFFKALNIGEICEACFMGCPVLGCQEGRIGQLLMEAERLTLNTGQMDFLLSCS